MSDSGERHDLLPPGKPLGLVVYLACSPGKSATREHLADLLWADLDVEAARHSVRQAVWFLRQRLGERAIVTRDGSMTLGITLESDRDAFLKAIEAIEFERAVEHYRGDFLPGFAAPGGADFEHWADLERFRLRRLFLRAGDTVVRDWIAKGRLRRARELATRVRDADTLDQSGWRLLLETLLAAHDRVAVEVEAQRLDATLARAERPAEPATRALLALAGKAPADSSIAPTRPRLAAELIGREREFAFILSAWDAARGGSGRHVHVTAAAGLGKSRLLADVHARLRAAGARALAVRANPGERAVPCALAADLALALAQLPGSAAVSPDSAAALVALNPTLSSQYQVPADRASDLEAVRRREIALGELLSTVADEQPVAVLIDDVQWADDPSRQILSHVAARALAHRVLLVTTARPGAGSTLGRVSLEPLVLDPLSAAETNALLASLGRFPPEPWGRWLSDALHLATRGTPLLILETLHLLIERRALALEDGVWLCPDVTTLATELAKGGALRRRIDELARDEKWLLTLLATAGTPLDPDLIVRALNRGAAAVQADLAALELRGFATRDGAEWQPAHDEIASRTLDLAPPEALRAAHTTIGRQLAASARDDPGVLHRAARHLAAAGEERELARIFRRRVFLQRRRGERRPARALATDLLGDSATPARIQRLVRSLPIYVRLGLVTRSRLAAAALTLLGVAIGAVALTHHSTSPWPDAWLVMIHENPGDSLSAIELPLRRDGWENLARLDATRLGRPVPALAVHGDHGDARPSPDGTTWVYSRTTQDSGGIDLFSSQAGHVERRLTATAGDDVNPSWSPDGRRLAIGTTRWSPSHYQDLAILDTATGRVTRLTFDSGSGGPHWSPDGSRLAYSHEDHQGAPDAIGHNKLCWITVDASRHGCLDQSWWEFLGWYDAEQFIIALSTPTRPLARINVTTGELHLLGASLNGGTEVSPDGRWIACFCVRPGTPDPEWYVFPTDRPDLWRHIMMETEHPAAMLIRFIPNPAGASYVDRIEIVAPVDTVPLHTRYRLRFRALDMQGSVVPLPVVRWRSLDTSVAQIDDTSGVLSPLRPGSVTIQVSAGGWRQADRRLVIATSEPRTMLTEDWRQPLETGWVPYGDPMPVIATGPGGRPAFWNRGDGWYESGVYSRSRFDGARGLGVEAWWSTPVVGPRQQYLSLALIPRTDSLALARWDHHTGSAPLPGPSCNIRFPQTDGRPKHPALAPTGSPVPVPPWTMSGRWYRIRVQVFPDGRCGFAFNGTPIGVSDLSLPLGPGYRVGVSGNSLGNRMLVGPLTVWSGVRDDVDWTASGRPATASPRPAPPPPSSRRVALPRESPQTAQRPRTPRPRP